MIEPNYKQGVHTLSDGVRIEYRDYPLSGNREKTPVICLHGLTRNLLDFDELAPRISGLGHRVIVPSQRGRGGSDYDPVPERYRPDQYADDMIALLDHLVIPRAIFIGSSMGGIITMLVSHHEPARVAAAVLNDIGTDLDPAGVARIMGYVGGGSVFEGWTEAAIACRELNRHAFPHETSDAYWLDFAWRTCREDENGNVSFAYDPAIASVTRADHDAVPDYTTPFQSLAGKATLLVRGETSDLLNTATVAKMKKLHPNLNYVEVAGIGHVPFLTEPDAWQQVGCFLNSLDDSAADKLGSEEDYATR